MENIDGDKKYYVPDKLVCVKQDFLKEYTKESDEMAIIFNGIKNKKFLLSLKEICPKYLIGICRRRRSK